MSEVFEELERLLEAAGLQKTARLLQQERLEVQQSAQGVSAKEKLLSRRYRLTKNKLPTCFSKMRRRDFKRPLDKAPMPNLLPLQLKLVDG